MSKATVYQFDKPLFSLNEAHVSGAQLDHVNLAGMSIENAHLDDVQIYNSNLSDCHIVNSNLAGATILRSKLRKARMWDTDVSEATLRDADLSGLSLYDPGAGIDMSAIIGLTQAQLDEARADPDNPPKLNGILDAETGKPLVWRGKPVE